MTVDFSSLTEFAGELDRAGAQVVLLADGVVKKGALNIKKDAQARLRAQLSQPTSIPRLVNAISFDMISVVGVAGAEIGPDQAKSGLGVGVELGSVHHAPMPFLFPALDAEGPRFLAAAETIVAQAFRLV